MKNFNLIQKGIKELINSQLNFSSQLNNLKKYALYSLEEGLKSVHPIFLIKKIVKIEKVSRYLNENKDEYVLKIKIKPIDSKNSDNSDLNEEYLIYNLSKYKNILIIGGGKATAAMAYALINIIYPYIPFYGIINVPYGQNWDNFNQSDNIESKNEIIINYSSHPIPDLNGLIGTKKMIELIQNSDKSTLIIVLISGGGSALMPLPIEPITLEDLKLVNNILLKCGANIDEINCIRKHISAIKGGNLAKYIYPKDCIVLIISDVIGDNLDVIASGPTVPDNSTFQDAINIIFKYNIINTIPKSVIKYLELGSKGLISETPKQGDIIFSTIKNILIGSAEIAKKVIISQLEKYGGINLEQIDKKYSLKLMQGEAFEYGKYVAEKIISINQSQYLFEKNLFYFSITTGELTVTIKGNGIGGRNQEMVLSTLHHLLAYLNFYHNEIQKNKSLVKNLCIKFFLISIACDGIEGNSPAAGAFICSETINKVIESNLSPITYLQNNNSYNFFKQLNQSVEIGQTGTNVNDICILIIQKD